MLPSHKWSGVGEIWPPIVGSKLERSLYDLMKMDTTLSLFQRRPEWCAEVIERALLKKPEKAEVGRKLDPTWRSSKVRWLAYENGFADVLDALTSHVRFCANAFAIDIDDVPFLDVQFTEYGPGDFYGWHCDDWFAEKDSKSRKLSVTLLLNDDFEGGTFMFPEFPVPLKTGQGVVFPSITHHQVEKVTRGTRYSLVAWADGPKWR